MLSKAKWKEFCEKECVLKLVFAETVSSKDKEFKELKQVYSDLEKFFD
jgi:hypothetical protein